MSRPEYESPPEYYYNSTEAKKYTQNSRIIEIQTKLSERALEILGLPENGGCLILDVGCGSGLSGSCIENAGHMWIGCDISQDMLNIANESDLLGDLIARDMGCGVPFRSGIFDGVISISALQWLCYSNKKSEVASKRLTTFFQSLYSCMKVGAKAVFQLYPETPKQIELITSCATKCGFTGGLLIDYPHSSKAKKYYLCLFAGESTAKDMPKAKDGLEEEEEEEDEEGDDEDGRNKNMNNIFKDEIEYEKRNRNYKRRRGDKPIKKSREWILAKKERARKQGKEVRPDTKYTGRKRPHRF